MKAVARVRAERAGEAEAIGALVSAAFLGHPHSAGTEAAIVRALRAAGALSLSLVAECDERLIGHIAFSPITVEGRAGAWFGLGPLAVAPPCQRQGVGAELVRHGLQQLQERGAAGCVVLGDPAYYGRFGFRAVPGLVYPGPPPELFMALAWKGPVPQGVVAYHSGFEARD
ncbi:GNAT family N-acetyltransferase [Inhella sp.]|uniref:GNAT family N-acetyltransferase n=1 Tax=Inhella sp. TaxID=1921806 RepID=UPI0035B0E29B